MGKTICGEFVRVTSLGSYRDDDELDKRNGTSAALVLVRGDVSLWFKLEIYKGRMEGAHSSRTHLKQRQRAIYKSTDEKVSSRPLSPHSFSAENVKVYKARRRIKFARGHSL